MFAFIILAIVVSVAFVVYAALIGYDPTERAMGAGATFLDKVAIIVALPAMHLYFLAAIISASTVVLVSFIPIGFADAEDRAMSLNDLRTMPEGYFEMLGIVFAVLVS